MRNFRLDDEVYAAAQERAKREYTTVTAVIERYLAVWSGVLSSDVDEIAQAQPRWESKPPTLGYSKEQQARGKR